MTTHASNPGWLSNAMANAQLYDASADAFRDKEMALDSFKTITQVASREG